MGISIDKVGQTKAADQNTYLRFLRLRRIWWKIRYYRATCCVQIAGTGRTFGYSGPKVRQLLLGHYGESDVFSEFLCALNDGDVVWDVGADQGLYSIFAAHFVGPSGVVCAFEPQKRWAKEVERNARINKAHNLRLFRMALSNRSGTGHIDENRVYEISHGSVEIESGDNLIAKGVAPMPNVIKVDVEGGEWKVLDGMRKALSNLGCRFILVEIHSKNLCGRNPEDIEGLLSEFGFHIGTRRVRGSEELWIGQKL